MPMLARPGLSIDNPAVPHCWNPSCLASDATPLSCHCELICQTTLLYYTVMNKEPDNRELAQQVEFLKKDYEIMQTDIQATLEVMKSDIHGTLETMRADSAKRDTALANLSTEFAKRETRLILTIIGVILFAITIQSFVLN